MFLICQINFFFRASCTWCQEACLVVRSPGGSGSFLQSLQIGKIKQSSLQSKSKPNQNKQPQLTVIMPVPTDVHLQNPCDALTIKTCISGWKLFGQERKIHILCNLRKKKFRKQAFTKNVDRMCIWGQTFNNYSFFHKRTSDFFRLREGMDRLENMLMWIEPTADLENLWYFDNIWIKL